MKSAGPEYRVAMTGLPEGHRFGNPESKPLRAMQRHVAVDRGHQPSQLVSRHISFEKYSIQAVHCTIEVSHSARIVFGVRELEHQDDVASGARTRCEMPTSAQEDFFAPSGWRHRM